MPATAAEMSSGVHVSPRSAPVKERAVYELVVTVSAARAIRDGLPEAVAAAAIEFLTSALIATG